MIAFPKKDMHMRARCSEFQKLNPNSNMYQGSTQIPNPRVHYK